MKILSCCCCCSAERERRDITFMVIGLDGAGKTSVVRCLSKDVQSGPTRRPGSAATSHHSTHMKQGHYDITLLDMAGAVRLRSLWKNFFSKVHGLVFVVDSSNSERMSEAQRVLETVLADSQARGKPILILANKQDADDPLDEIAVFNQLGLELFQASHSLRCQVECCTASSPEVKSVNTGLKSGLQWLTREVSLQYGPLTARVQLESAQQEAAEQRQKRERLNKMHSVRTERVSVAEESAVSEVLAMAPATTLSAPQPRRRHSEDTVRNTSANTTAEAQPSTSAVPGAPVLGSKRESTQSLQLPEAESPRSEDASSGQSSPPVKFPVTLAPADPISGSGMSDSHLAPSPEKSRSYKRRSKGAVEPIMAPQVLMPIPHHRVNVSLFSSPVDTSLPRGDPCMVAANRGLPHATAETRSELDLHGSAHPQFVPDEAGGSFAQTQANSSASKAGRIRLEPIRTKRKQQSFTAANQSNSAQALFTPRRVSPPSTKGQ